MKRSLLSLIGIMSLLSPALANAKVSCQGSYTWDVVKSLSGDMRPLSANTGDLSLKKRTEARENLLSYCDAGEFCEDILVKATAKMDEPAVIRDLPRAGAAVFGMDTKYFVDAKIFAKALNISEEKIAALDGMTLFSTKYSTDGTFTLSQYNVVYSKEKNLILFLLAASTETQKKDLAIESSKDLGETSVNWICSAE
jgi:hypothetical protein